MPTLTAFFEDRIIVRGTRDRLTREVEEKWPDLQGQLRVFDDRTGRPVDLDLWDASALAKTKPVERRPGRPSLGVTSREVTLLPRHWEWLASQPGGASAALRRLVDRARKDEGAGAGGREALHVFLTNMAGDRPGYEEALRALYRGDKDKLLETMAAWPSDIRVYAEALLGGSAEAA